MTDTKLKLKLAEYLPEEIEVSDFDGKLQWCQDCALVLDTELLEICHRIEGKMTPKQETDYTYLIDVSNISNPIMATWQQRATAIIQTLGTI